ncbi:helix-turn-helix domain-containing protein [Nocardia wallacei]|uniref:helix-turn-helix domain-containing protein n=1 Tax=Nocardia wallacei TaxID=480035 RepID=UPI002454E77D|nr:helix-turn-helix transcriptional regulator [Nocardia wallacei]
MTDSVQQAREALGLRLREIRRTAGLNGRQLASLAGWHESKVSKIEYGKIKPSDADLRAYCAHSGALDQLPDLAATLHHIEAAYLEWRRILNTGTKRVQNETVKLAQQTKLMRIYQPIMVPGILQTADYAAAVLRKSIDFFHVPDDLEQGVAKRLERQQVLYHGKRQFRIIMGEQALHTTVGGDDIMAGQLDRLIAVIGLPRVLVGIVPADAELTMATTNFVIYDNRMVLVEAITAELTITQPREIAQYAKVFDTLARRAVFGETARTLIGKALEQRRSRSGGGP